jgi:hypothetical protein
LGFNQNALILPVLLEQVLFVNLNLNAPSTQQSEHQNHGEMPVTWAQQAKGRRLLAYEVSTVHLDCGGFHLNLHTG